MKSLNEARGTKEQKGSQPSLFNITVKVNLSTGTHLISIVGQRLWHSGKAHDSFQGDRGFEYRREFSGSLLLMRKQFKIYKMNA